MALQYIDASPSPQALCIIKSSLSSLYARSIILHSLIQNLRTSCEEMEMSLLEFLNFCFTSNFYNRYPFQLIVVNSVGLLTY